jgi:hypothetical protein
MDKLTRMRVEFLFAGLLLVVAATCTMIGIVTISMNPSMTPALSWSALALAVALFIGVLGLGIYYVIKCWWPGFRAHAASAGSVQGIARSDRET